MAQIFFELDDPSTGEEDLNVDLDYAFAEIFISDLAKARIGRVKHPFGIYTEVYDVGTVRPFYTLPQSIYGPQGIVSKAYNGVGFTGARGGGAEGWGFQYDVYGGQLESQLGYPGVLGGSVAQEASPVRLSRSAPGRSSQSRIRPPCGSIGRPAGRPASSA